MNKNIILSSIAIVALVSLIGCGSGSSNSNESSSDNENGSGSASSSSTGHYLDSAIGGVDYACGSLSSVTDTDGKFSYELNKECTFSVGNIVLRKVSKDDLSTNSVTIIENNMTVARLLQTMDNDGDASNGINISEKIRDALKQNGISDRVDIGSLYNNVIVNTEGYQGHLVTETEASEHLQATIKTILAGKTFYAVTEPSGTFLGNSVVTNDTSYVIPFSFNDDLTMLNEGTEDATAIEFNGNRLIYPENGTSSYQLIVGKTDKYIRIQTIFVAGSSSIGYMRLYFNQGDAQTYADAIKNGTNDEASDGMNGGVSGGTNGGASDGTNGGTNSGTLSLEGRNTVFIKNHINTNMVEVYTSMYKNRDAFTSSTTSTPTSCKDYGFTNLVNNINIGDATQKSYTIETEVDNTVYFKYCYEEDYAESTSSGSTNLVMRYNSIDHIGN